MMTDTDRGHNPANLGLSAEALFIAGICVLIYRHEGRWGWMTEDKATGAYPFRRREDARDDAMSDICAR